MDPFIALLSLNCYVLLLDPINCVVDVWLILYFFRLGIVRGNDKLAYAYANKI